VRSTWPGFGERRHNFVGQHSWARGFFVNTVGRDEEPSGQMRKKSAEVSLTGLQKQISEIRTFLVDAEASAMPIRSLSRCYDQAVIWCYRAFEEFVLDVLVGQINRSPANLYASVGVSFGKNPTAAQCEYLLVGDRYFDFRGHSGLVDVVKKASGRGSAIENAVKVTKHRQCFEILTGLRNYAAHQSDQSKNAALRAMKHWEPDRKNLGSGGIWLRVARNGQRRMERLLARISHRRGLVFRDPTMIAQ
jgi:hypothetical protein